MSNPESLPNKPCVVVTSISAPNDVLRSITDGARKSGFRFIVIGDSKSPVDFTIPECEFFGLQDQRRLDFSYTALCPERSYTRKNIGYLLAIADKAPFIVETDDDNFPREAFWDTRKSLVDGDLTHAQGWVNAYAWFTNSFIYPRGFPLREARSKAANTVERISAHGPVFCPIQQGLADENPDVDAVYRMLYPLPFNFQAGRPIILSRGQWCPFNSQNTTFFPEAYPLLYLPAYCSFRMTDIWRSFVAQRISWEYGWSISFHSATVYQERNEHDLMRDFTDEVSGYLNNEKIVEALGATVLSSATGDMFENLIRCYKTLIALALVAEEELQLLNVWIDDLKRINVE